MATQAQIDANRRNAQNSTGPKSEQGKAISAKNALKHGLRAEFVLLPDENKTEFEQFAVALTAELNPRGLQQEMVVERLIHLHWKLRRVPRMEHATTRELMSAPGPLLLPIQALSLDLRSVRQRKTISALNLLQIYEQRMQRMIDAAMRELRQLRKEAAKADDEAGDGAPRDGSDHPAADAVERKRDSDERSQSVPKSPSKPQLPGQSRVQDSAWLRQVCEPPNGARSYRIHRGTDE